MEFKHGKDPFFIIGCPRSGTTVFQLLLDAHPNIAIPPESHFFLTYGRLLENPAFDITNSRHYAIFLKMVVKDWRLSNWNLTSSLSLRELFLEKPPRSQGDFIHALFMTYALQEGKQRWGDKTPQHALCLQTILRVFPNARIVHLLRDGRDVAESLGRVHIGPQSILGRAKRWRKYMKSVEQARQYIPPLQFMEVRFEDLVERKGEIVNSVLEFLGEDLLSVPVCMADTTSAKQYKNSSSLHQSSVQPFSSEKIGVYRKALTLREQEIFEQQAGAELTRYGYSMPERTVEPLVPDVWERVYFFLEDSVWRYVRKLLRPTDYALMGKQLVDRVQAVGRSIRMLGIR